MLVINSNIQTESTDPLINFVDHLLQDALNHSASDIHIEPYEKLCRIRFRQDGILHETTQIPPQLSERLITRLKVMSKLDIAERRLPQDGHFQFMRSHLNNIDIRINTCPTLFGEKVVLRLLNANKIQLDIHQLGLTDTQEQVFIEAIHQAQGMILVTGPTGSGKTVTLYSALSHLNSNEKNISTVEDPIEIQLQGINQVSIHPKIGLDFAAGLRTLLRQDPNIIMVGEIRDSETAQIAIQAAQTGHLVLSTVHTKNALETLARLQSLSISAYDLMHSVTLIIAQRLVRKLCSHCKQAEIIPPHIIPGIDIPLAAFRPQGCQHCLHGYLGRIGIFEFLAITPCLKQLLQSHASVADIQNHLDEIGFISLYQQALQKVRDGSTSLTEINRIVSM